MGQQRQEKTMNYVSKLSILATLAITGILGCGNTGTNNVLGFGNEGSLTGLYPVSSTPANNAYYVGSNTKTFMIRMNEDVDQASALANIQFGKAALDSNGQPYLVQAMETESVVVTGSLITISFKEVGNTEVAACSSVGALNPGGSTSSTSPSTQYLDENENYAVLLYPTLAAVSGNTLLQGQAFSYYAFYFSTGAAGAFGNSKAGAPHPVKAAVVDRTSCVVDITFSEDLQYAPTTVYFGNTERPSNIVYPAFPGNMSVWRVEKPSSYNCIATVEVRVYNDDYFDLSGETGNVCGGVWTSGNLNVVF
jgi:hypothetical protein